MALGSKANNYFSDQAPWALIKEDKEKAGAVLAHSSAFALCLGVVMQPFLPELSAKILDHFDELLSSEIVGKLYAGELSVLDQVFANGHTLKNEVVALVPKIQDEVIEAKKESLK